MIIVVEGPSAAGKTTWCRTHAPRWLPEPGPWPTDEVRRYQLDRWAEAVEADRAGEVIVLDGDPFKLYYAWAQRALGLADEPVWADEVSVARSRFASGALGLADVVLYDDPGVDELSRRRAADTTRTRRRFDLHTSMRPFFRAWYESVASLDPARVVWRHPPDGVTTEVLAVGRRDPRDGVELFDQVLARLGRPDGSSLL